MSNLSLPSAVELISVHVPKTAGSTFGYVVLPQIYSPHTILYDYDYLPINTLIQQGKLSTKTKVIHGHFPGKKYREHYPNTKMVIWLRNPVISLISAYYFWMTLNPDYILNKDYRYVVDNKLDFPDFIKLPFTHNIISSYFAKGMKLTDFYFVGIQEFFMDDLNDIKNNLGWHPFKVQTSNRNSYYNYKEQVMDALNNQSLVKSIVAFNSGDMELYQEALSLRSQRKGASSYIEMYELSLTQSQSRLRYNSSKETKLNKCSSLGSEQGGKSSISNEVLFHSTDLRH
ncbi:MAG: hypothetical protein ACBR13_08560 [Microcoleus sp.]